MALRKYPKKPKKSASIEAKERYLQRVKEIDKHNAQVKSDKKKSADLDKKIAGIGKAK